MITSEDIIRALQGADLPPTTEPLRADVPFVNLGLDSLDIANLIIAVEERFQRIVGVDEMTRLRTIDDIAAFLNRANH